MSISQTNLIPNGGFNEIDSCPNNQGEGALLTNWFVPNDGSPDLFHECANSLSCGIPFTYFGCQFEPFEGSGMIWMTVYRYYEYITCRLDEPMIISASYQFSMRIRKVCGPLGSIGSLGVVLSTESLPYQMNLYSGYEMSPTLNHDPFNFLNDSSEWYLYKDTLVCDSGYNFVTIGNFVPFDSTPYLPHSYTDYEQISGYFFDDIRLELISSVSVINRESVSDNGYQIEVFPNPTTGTLRIEAKQPLSGTVALTLCDARGQRLIEQQMNTSTVTLELGGLANGVYFLLAQDRAGGRLWHEKVVVMRE